VPFLNVDWAKAFLPDESPVELIARGTVLYLAIFLLLRFGPRRQTGTLSRTDLLVIVLIADAAQNGMAGTYASVADGVILVSTIVFWSSAVDQLAYRFPILEPIVHPPPEPVIENGRLNRRTMRAEMITPEELMSQLRLQGIEDMAVVKRAFIEGNGELSVVRVDDEPTPKRERRVA
jgi:uncharacterized membrane protein YcaP (DUF421 family)